MKDSVLIIGGGAMGGALARCWHAANLLDIQVVEHHSERAEALRALGIIVHDALPSSPTPTALVLAIKPQQFAEMVPQLRAACGPDTLLISIMAGTTLATLAAVSDRTLRVMPNLPVTVGAGMSVLCAPTLNAADRAFAERLFAATGSYVWVADEALLPVATAISGSGPGYLFMFMQALEAAAIAHGLDAPTARLLVSQTVSGAGALAAASQTSFSELTQQVASKGGTTEAALSVFHAGDFNRLIAAAVEAALSRAHALANG